MTHARLSIPVMLLFHSTSSSPLRWLDDYSYEGEQHSSLGYVLLLGVAGLALLDIVRFFSFAPASSSRGVKGLLRRPDRQSALEEEEIPLTGTAFDAREFEIDDAEDAKEINPDTGHYQTSSPKVMYMDEIDLLDGHTANSPPSHSSSPTSHSHRNVIPKPKSLRMSNIRNSVHSYHSEHSATSTLHDETEPPHHPTNDGQRKKVQSSLAYQDGVDRQPRRKKRDYHDDRRDDWLHSSSAYDHHEDDHDSPIPPAPSPSRLSRVVYIAEWVMVILAYAEMITGGVVYSGICTNTYANGCLAHLISESSISISS